MPTIFRRSLELFVRAPVVGLALGFALVLGAVMLSTGSFLAFFSIEGLVIVEPETVIRRYRACLAPAMEVATSPAAGQRCRSKFAG